MALDLQQIQRQRQNDEASFTSITGGQVDLQLTKKWRNRFKALTHIEQEKFWGCKGFFPEKFLCDFADTFSITKIMKTFFGVKSKKSFSLFFCSTAHAKDENRTIFLIWIPRN